MTARLLMAQDDIDAPGGRAAWLDLRRDLITGSEIAAVLGLSPYMSPFALYHAKLDGYEVEDSAAMERGRYCEPLAVDRFAARHPWFKIMPGGLYASHTRPWMAATLDRLAIDTQAADDLNDGYLSAIDAAFPVQIKTSHMVDEWGPDGSAVIPVAYRAQALWEMEVWAADTVIVVCHFMVPWETRIYVLDRDRSAQADIDLMVTRAEEFRNRLAVGAPPEVDWTPATTATLRRIHPDLEDREADIGRGLARRYELARARAQREQQRLQAVQNLIRDRIGPARVAVASDQAGIMVKVCSRSISDVPVKAHTRRVDRLSPGKWRGTP